MAGRVRDGSARGLVALLITATALAAAACGDGGDGTTERRRAVPEGEAGASNVTPARYVTDVSFVPFAPDGHRLHFRFRHVTSSEELFRDYRGWRLGAGGWSPSLALRDTLPLPRAGWRVLPATGLRVVAGRAGGLEALVRQGAEGTERLELGRTVARWQSPTGQRERFRLATAVSDGDRRRGLAVQRRSALAAEAPPPRGLYGFLLVADSTGEGLVVLRHGGTPPGRRPPEVDTTAVAYGWTGGSDQAWRDVRLEAAGGSASGEEEEGRRSPPPGGWAIEIPAGGISGRLAPGALERVESGAADAGSPAGGGDRTPRPVRLYAVSGTLAVYGETRTVRGLGVEAGQP